MLKIMKPDEVNEPFMVEDERGVKRRVFNEEDDDDDFDRIGAPNVGQEDDDDEESRSGSDESSDAEMADDDLEDGVDVDEMDLPGHR